MAPRRRHFSFHAIRRGGLLRAGDATHGIQPAGVERLTARILHHRRKAPFAAPELGNRFQRGKQAHLQTEGLSNALASLDARSRHIITARWLTGEDGKAATLHELAAEYGVSAERIRQIEAKALKQMRGELAELA